MYFSYYKYFNLMTMPANICLSSSGCRVYSQKDFICKNHTESEITVDFIEFKFNKQT